MSGVFSSTSVFGDTSDEVLVAINQVNVLSPSGEAASPTTLSGKFEDSQWGDSDKDAKQVKVVSFTKDKTNNTCCGQIGDKNISFCTKNKSNCSSYSNGGKHKQNTFSPLEDHYYICKSVNGDSAWCQHALPASRIINKTLFNKDVGLGKTVNEWTVLFKAALEIDDATTSEEVKKFVQFMDSPVKLKALKTPGKMRNLQLELQTDEASFPFSSTNMDTELSILQLSDADLQSLKSSSLPPTITNLIMGIVGILQKLFFQFQETRGELLQKALHLNDEIFRGRILFEFF